MAGSLGGSPSRRPLRPARTPSRAALADLSLSTVRRAQRYLVGHGYLEKGAVGGGRASTRWKIFPGGHAAVIMTRGANHLPHPRSRPRRPERL